jgi:hypothetical protein
VRHKRRTAVAGADDVDHVQVVLLDQPVQVHINEIESGGGAPVPEQPRLDVFRLERGLQQGIILEINLPDREIIRRAPIRVHFLQQIGRQGSWHRGLLSSGL